MLDYLAIAQHDNIRAFNEISTCIILTKDITLDEHMTDIF